MWQGKENVSKVGDEWMMKRIREGKVNTIFTLIFRRTKHLYDFICHEMVPFTTPDTSNPRHIKTQTHQTSDTSKNIGLPTTQKIKIPFYISSENPIDFQVFK